MSFFRVLNGEIVINLIIFQVILYIFLLRLSWPNGALSLKVQYRLIPNSGNGIFVSIYPVKNADNKEKNMYIIFDGNV